MGVTTIDQKIAEFFNGLQVNGWSYGNFILCAIAILLSVLLCGMIGLEREKKGRSAGLRTHLLVGVGSCIVMIISIYGFPMVFTQNGDGATVVTTRDVARLAAGCIAGVGFLGAGAIIHNNGGIKGLTTASTIWLVMAIGLACGSMNFILAIGSTLAVMIILVAFRKIERRVARSNPMFVVLVDSNMPVMTRLLNISKKYNYTISDVTSQIVENGLSIEVTFKIMGENGKEVDITSFVVDLENTEGIKNIQVLNHH